MTSMSIQDNDCLLIIDVQNDFCSAGSLAVPDAEAILPLINELAPQFSTVVLTQDWHPAGHSSFASSHPDKQAFETITLPYGEQTLWPDHCIQGSRGADFHPDLQCNSAQLIIRKGFRSAIDSYSAFYENDHTTTTGLTGYLRQRGIQRLFCVGLALDYCVRYSALDARREGFDAVVLEQACRGIDIEGSNEAARAAMRDAGVIIAS
ncbi:bifunctional nicotinamidase/pyrazinamidase [Granulosicoccus sp. 3-233]|uniref:bifunctional nicotinamidase/pyrazinamidase n=1 Tax=Granulosicoccus sp. 3-233 TaxID=3417969 RepID=UPI003D33CD7F